MEVGFDAAWFPSVSAHCGRLADSKLEFLGDVWRIGLGDDGRETAAPRRFISSTRLDLQPDWSPDGNRIAFISSRSGGREVWVHELSSARLQKLTSFGTAHTLSPAWSPDGSQIVFTSDLEGSYDLWLLGLNPIHPRRLTESPADEGGAVWSRDGETLYFTSNQGGETQLWRMPVRGGDAVQLTVGGGGGVRVSPDGEHLYYAKISTGPTPVWRVSTNSGDETEVLGREWGATEFAVTAQHLYFIPMADASWKRTLMRMDLLSGEVEQISVLRSGSATPICSCERWAGQGLAISPDGKTILFGQVDQIDSDVMLVDGWR